MKIKQYYIYLADFDPQFGTEPGKIRPAVVVQTNLLNDVGHGSSIVCPISASIKEGATLLRVHLPKKRFGLKKDSDILVDQIRSIDNRRFIKKIGQITAKQKTQLRENLTSILFE